MNLNNTNVSIRILNKKQIAVMLDKSTNTIERWVRYNIFPQPIRFTRKSIGWLEHDVINWINERRAEA